jgi:hypothetical protein
MRLHGVDDEVITTHSRTGRTTNHYGIPCSYNTHRTAEELPITVGYTKVKNTNTAKQEEPPITIRYTTIITTDTTQQEELPITMGYTTV